MRTNKMKKEKNPISSRPVCPVVLTYLHLFASSRLSPRPSSPSTMDHQHHPYPYPQQKEMEKNVTLVCRVPWNYSSLHVMSAECTCMYGHFYDMMMMTMTRKKRKIENFSRLSVPSSTIWKTNEQKEKSAIQHLPLPLGVVCKNMKESITSIRAHNKFE